MERERERGRERERDLPFAPCPCGGSNNVSAPTLFSLRSLKLLINYRNAFDVVGQNVHQ